MADNKTPEQIADEFMRATPEQPWDASWVRAALIKVVQNERAAVRRVTPDREALAKIIDPSAWRGMDLGIATEFSRRRESSLASADALLASGVLGVPAEQRTADRETIARAIWYANVADLPFNEWDRRHPDQKAPIYKLADAVLAVLVPAKREPGVPIDEHDNQVRAETLEAAADELAEHYLVPGGIVQQVQAVYDMGAKVANAHGAVPWLRARAAEYRKAAGA